MKLVSGDRLLGDSQVFGDVFIGPALDDQKLDAAESVELAAIDPIADESAEGFGEHAFLGDPTFVASGDARRGARSAGDFLKRAAVVVGAELVDRPSALLAKVVGQFVGGDREQIRFGVAFLVVMRQAGEEADKRFLNDVLAGGAIAQAAIDERQQAAFKPFDEVLPGARVARPDLLDQEFFGVGGRHRVEPFAREKRASEPFDGIHFNASATGLPRLLKFSLHEHDPWASIIGLLRGDSPQTETRRSASSKPNEESDDFTKEITFLIGEK